MYKISVVPPDLRHEETIIQAANALDSLQKTINSVFEHIDARTQRNNAKVQELSERIARAQAKVRGLVGTKKAIKIYAPARFPATQVFSDIPQTFAMAAPTAICSEMMDSDQTMIAAGAYEVQSRVEAPSTQALQDKLVFFHVRSKEAQSIKPSVGKNNQLPQGLGIIPGHLHSANALVVFNSDELSYDADGVEKGTWKRAKLFKSQRLRSQGAQIGVQKQLLEPAPHSLVNRNQRATVVSGLRYTPKLNEAPEIDLPLDLPDLPGIADDIHFEGKAQQQIAPSLFIDNLPDLPELQEEDGETEQDENGEEKLAVAAAFNDSIPITDNKPPVSAAKSEAQRPVPPPPPPPPPPLQLQLPKVQPPSGDTVALPAPDADSRSELMDAIRKAGGARGGRLRTAPAAAPIDTVDNRHNATARATSEEKVPARGDLMADLHHKLQMRRKGISGAKASSNAESGNPVISRLSALIPAPTARKQSDDEDEDNDDDNDADWAE